jgi:hypothetical protein
MIEIKMQHFCKNKISVICNLTAQKLKLTFLLKISHSWEHEDYSIVDISFPTGRTATL